MDRKVCRRARTERGKTRGGATKKREISRNLLSINLNFSVHGIPSGGKRDPIQHDKSHVLGVA